MGLEVVTDDDDVGASGISRLHRFGGTYSATHDKRDGGVFSHLADDVRRDGELGARTGFQVDGFFAHQFGRDTGVDDGLNAFGV